MSRKRPLRAQFLRPSAERLRQRVARRQEQERPGAVVQLRGLPLVNRILVLPPALKGEAEDVVRVLAYDTKRFDHYHLRTLEGVDVGLETWVPESDIQRARYATAATVAAHPSRAEHDRCLAEARSAVSSMTNLTMERHGWPQITPFLTTWDILSTFAPLCRAFRRLGWESVSSISLGVKGTREIELPAALRDLPSQFPNVTALRIEGRQCYSRRLVAGFTKLRELRIRQRYSSGTRRGRALLQEIGAENVSDAAAAGAGAVRDVLTRPTGKHTFNSEWFTPSAGFAGGALSVCTLGARLTTLELLFPPVLGVAEDGLAAIASHCRALRNLQLDFRRLERHRGLFDWAAEDTTTLVDIVRSCSLLRELGIRSCGSLSDAALGCTADVLGSRLLRLGIENCTALTMRSVRHVGRVCPRLVELRLGSSTCAPRKEEPTVDVSVLDALLRRGVAITHDVEESSEDESSEEEEEEEGGSSEEEE